MSNGDGAQEQKRLPDFESAEDRPFTTMPAPADGQPDPRITGGPAPLGDTPDPRITGGPAPLGDTPDPRITGGPAPLGDTPNPGIGTMSAPADGGPRPASLGVGTAQVDDPQELREAGKGARTLAGELKTHGDRGSSALVMGVQSFLEDWSGDLPGAIVTAQERWDEQVAELRRVCLHVASSCTATADNQTTTETANSDAIKSLSDFD